MAHEKPARHLVDQRGRNGAGKTGPPSRRPTWA